MQVSKWGNSLAIRLPTQVVKELHLKEGDDIEVLAQNKVFKIAKKPSATQKLSELRKFRGRLPADFKFDRIDAHQRD